MSYLKNFKFDIYGPENGKKLVFLHGVMGSGANWRKITPAFQNDYQILTFDQRGHGWSFKPESGYGPENYATDLKLILEELRWGEVAVIGHSMGGRNALHFTDLYPEIVKALAIEDIGPQGNPQAMKKTISLVEMVPTPFENKKAAKAFFENEFVKTLGGSPKARVLGQYFYTNIEEQKNGSADWRFSKKSILSTLLEGHFQPRWEMLGRLRAPTLFIRGEYSEDFPREEYEQILSKYPQIKGVEIAQAGHWVHFDQPEAFIQSLKTFFAAIQF